MRILITIFGTAILICIAVFSLSFLKYQQFREKFIDQNAEIIEAHFLNLASNSPSIFLSGDRFIHSNRKMYQYVNRIDIEAIKLSDHTLRRFSDNLSVQIVFSNKIDKEKYEVEIQNFSSEFTEITSVVPKITYRQQETYDDLSKHDIILMIGTYEEKGIFDIASHLIIKDYRLLPVYDGDSHFFIDPQILCRAAFLYDPDQHEVSKSFAMINLPPDLESIDLRHCVHEELFHAVSFFPDLESYSDAETIVAPRLYPDRMSRYDKAALEILYSAPHDGQIVDALDALKTSKKLSAALAEDFAPTFLEFFRSIGTYHYPKPLEINIDQGILPRL